MSSKSQGGRTGIARRARHRNVATYIALIFVCVIFFYPLVWMVLGSLKLPQEFFSNMWGLPHHWSWSDYTDAWNVAKMGEYLRNSVIVTASSVALVLVLSNPMGYALARMKFAGSRLLLGFFLIMFFIPTQLLIIPLYQLESNMHIMNSYLGLILPYSAGSLAFGVVFTTTYFRSIPAELEEAALLDGCNRGQILVRVMVPLSKPAFATVGIMTFLTVWNEFILALTLTQSDSVRTLPVGLLNFSQLFGVTNYSQLFAALTISAMPIVAFFIFTQRYFIQGLVAGAIKA